MQITQSQIRIGGLSLKNHLAMAFRLQPHQISGPAWLGSTRFDISAKLPDGVPPQQIPEMLQALFADRFKLRTHFEKRETPVYALEVIKSGLTLEKVAADRDVKEGALVVGGSGSTAGIAVDLGRGSSYSFADNRLEGKKLTMVMLARTLTPYVGRPIVDMTNVEGYYDLTLTLTPEEYQVMLIRSADATGVALPAQALRLLETSSIDSLLESLRKAGLTLEPQRALPSSFFLLPSSFFLAATDLATSDFGHRHSPGARFSCRAEKGFPPATPACESQPHPAGAAATGVSAGAFRLDLRARTLSAELPS